MSEPDDRLVRRVVRAAGARDAAEACPDAEMLGLYAEHELDGAERVEVETHLAGCGRCQAMLAEFVRSAPGGGGAVGTEGHDTAAETGARAWWSGWKWLVPVAATAAVVTIAVWVRQPGESMVQDQEAPEAMAMRQPETALTQGGRSEPAGVAAEVPGTASAETSGRMAPGGEAVGGPPARRDPGPGGTPSMASSGQAARGAEPAGQAIADARTEASSVPAGAAGEKRLERVEATAAADAPAPTGATGLATAAPAGTRPADTLADARERPVPAAPMPPAAQASTSPAEPGVAEAFGRRQADRAESNRVGAAAQAKATAGGEAKTAGAGRGAAETAAAAVAAGAATTQTAQLTGRVTYRTRAALPVGAVIDVRLLDVSRVDAPATMLGRVEIVTRGEQVPLPFAIGYDASAIDPRLRYTVQATITIAGRVAYRTTTAHLVITSGAPAANVEVVVEPLR